MKHYERPVVLATYTVEELVEEATVCMRYGSGVSGSHGSHGPVTRSHSVGPAALPDTGASGLDGGNLLGGIVAGISLLAAGVYTRFRRR